MSLTLTPLTTVAILALTAASYTVATVGMKQFSGAPGILAIALITGGLAVAVVMEVILLRQGNLSLVYLGIMIAETALVLVYAYSIGHGLSLGQVTGAAFVLFGIAIMGAHT
ncbi:MAG: 5-aminolevulinate synthase [Sulfitobacter sp.]